MNFERKSQFKETEIGRIPKDWNLITLKVACSKIGSGITPRGGTNVYTSEGTALIRSQNVLNNSFSADGLVYLNEDWANEMENVTVTKHDVLLNITGDSVARCCTVPDTVLPARVNQHVSIIRTNGKEFDPIFLKYYLTTPKMQNHMLSLAQSGGTRNALTKGMIENFVIPKPDMNEQKAIVCIFSNLDSKIELNQRINRTLQSIGRAVFKRWFIDFEFPNEEGKPYKSSGGKMVIDSNLNKNVPGKWSIRNLGYVAKIQPGYAFQSNDFIDSGRKIIKIADIQNFVVDTQGGDYVSEEVFSKIDDRFHVVSGDIVIAMTGAKLGKVGIVPNVHLQMLLNQRVGKVVSQHKFFTYLLLTSNETQELLRGYSSGSSAQGNISNSDIEQIGIPLPDNGTLNAFNKKTYPLYEKLVLNLGEKIILETIRDLLLPKLMSGKIRVPIHNKMEIQ